MTDGVKSQLQEGLKEIDLLAYEITEDPSDRHTGTRAGIIRKLTALLQETLQDTAEYKTTGKGKKTE